MPSPPMALAPRIRRTYSSGFSHRKGVVVDTVNDLVWRGRIQLGDEPGIYSDSQYGGLSLELPIELLPYSGNLAAEGNLTIVLEASEVKIYEGYQGHPVTLFGVFQDTAGNWARRILARAELNNANHGMAELRVHGPIPQYVSVRAEINSQLPPGLYDEIVIHRLTIQSATHYGYLGFRYPNAALKP